MANRNNITTTEYMAQTLDITRDKDGLIVGLAGLFEKRTNGNDAEDHYQPSPVVIDVPKNTVAFVSGVLTVDDWGYVDITSNGQTARVINLTSEIQPAGPRGGHPRWSGEIENPVELGEGKHTIVVHQDNAPYSAEYESVSYNNISFCEVSLSIVYKRVNLMTKAEATDWLNAYAPVNYVKMPSSSTVYAYVGGELNHLHLTDKDYADSCALRVSIALSTLGDSLQGEPGAALYDNVEHLKGGYAIVGAANMTTYLTKKLGPPTYGSIKAYKEEMEGGDIIAFGGVNVNNQAHVGIATGANPESGGGLTSSVWVLNRPSWIDPKK